MILDEDGNWRQNCARCKHWQTWCKCRDPRHEPCPKFMIKEVGDDGIDW